MNVLIVLAHPEPTSFNHALAETARAALTGVGHEVVLSVLTPSGSIRSRDGTTS